jgi:hypothetical protein
MFATLVSDRYDTGEIASVFAEVAQNLLERVD